MNEGAVLPVPPRRLSPVGVLLGGVGVFVLGLFAVGSGHFYRGDTWPDYVVMLAASVLILFAFVDWSGRDGAGVWSWRKLRVPSFLACGLALVLLLVMSGIVPVEQGVWAEGDSAQGFSMFTFLGSVAVAITATVKAPRSPGITQLTWDPAVGGLHSEGAVRIVLRRYRFLSRPSYVDLDAAGATLVVPRVFGGRAAWFIPMETIGVVLPDQDLEGEELPDGAGDDWVTSQEFRTPYLSTTSPFSVPNLELFFTVAQPIPPIRWFAGRDLDISPIATRRESGFMVDGVQLRVVQPEAARQALLATGAQGIADPDSFVQQHRDVLRDPEQVRALAAQACQSFRLMLFSGVATLALFIAFQVTDDERYFIGLVFVLALTFLLERMRRRQDRA